MAKKNFSEKPTWLEAPAVSDVYSVSDCVNENFVDYIPDWKHNGFWVFDSPDAIRAVAQAHSIDLHAAKLFYYEAHHLEFHDGQWPPFAAEASIATEVIEPSSKICEGFDVVTFWAGNSPEHSPLSCNSLASTIPTNSHCLFATLDEALNCLNAGTIKQCELGPYRNLRSLLR